MRHAKARKDGREGSSAALRRKLMAYGLGAGGAVATSLAGADSAWGAIIHYDPTDVTALFPNGRIYFDLGLTPTSYPLYDFTLFFGPPGNPLSEKPRVAALGTNAVVATPAVPSDNYASKLNPGDSIGPGSPFVGANAAIYFEKNENGPWDGGATAYAGLRIGSGSNFGWARINYDDDANSLTLLDFAVETSAGVAILAGDIGQVAVTVPEPNALLLAAAGASGLSLLRRRRKERDTGASPKP